MRQPHAEPGGGAAAGRWVIVTAERTTSADAYAGLPVALHVTYATVTHTRSDWIVETWQPQNQGPPAKDELHALARVTAAAPSPRSLPHVLLEAALMALSAAALGASRSCSRPR